MTDIAQYLPLIRANKLVFNNVTEDVIRSLRNSADEANCPSSWRHESHQQLVVRDDILDDSPIPLTVV
jgi:hypothetical protein